MRTLKVFLPAVFCVALIVSPAVEADAAIPIAKIIQEGMKKVIKAVDLMIQRMQNKTIWMQNAQKVLENRLNELKLKEIAEWTEKHRQLYEEYYNELWKVKNAIATYQLVRQIIEKQSRLVREYRKAWELVRRDEHFTKGELEYMYRVYSGILKESGRNLNQIISVIKSLELQMSDASRLRIIQQAADAIDRNYSDLREFNAQNVMLSLNRAKDQSDIDAIKNLYGLK